MQVPLHFKATSSFTILLDRRRMNSEKIMRHVLCHLCQVYIRKQLVQRKLKLLPSQANCNDLCSLFSFSYCINVQSSSVIKLHVIRIIIIPIHVSCINLCAFRKFFICHQVSGFICLVLHNDVTLFILEITQ